MSLEAEDTDIRDLRERAVADHDFDLGALAEAALSPSAEYASARERALAEIASRKAGA
jgi:hypothetical protein